MNIPCGLRYMYDTLELQSGAGRRLLLDEVMPAEREEIGESYAKLREFFGKLSGSDIETLQVKLFRLRDIAGTLSRLASGAVLDDVELFEVKSLLLLASEVREVMAEKGLETVHVSPLCELPLRLLDPEGQRVPSFHVYDSYDGELAGLRARIRREPENAEELTVRALGLENTVRKMLSAQLRQHATLIWLTLETLAEADILLAKAVQMRKMGLIIPEISAEGSGNGGTVYEKMWHPQVKEWLAGRGGEFQPVDIRFGGEPVTVIGANMGGKTVVLKTVGLCQLLFQFGFGIPAGKAEIDIKQNIFVGIGDDDRSMQGLSSFANEVRGINVIMRAAREGGRNLALLDEPARTTNPVEGTALVEAFLKVMEGKGTDLIVTTHYNLKDIPGRRLKVRGLENGKMNYGLEETSESAVPREAVAIAESLGADAEWLEAAKEILANNDNGSCRS